MRIRSLFSFRRGACPVRPLRSVSSSQSGIYCAPRASCVALAAPGTVLLTREGGKNQAVMRLLDEKAISFYELPMVQTIEGPDAAELEPVLRAKQFTWIVVTSPEAATVFARAWTRADKPNVRLAVVGKGTAKALAACAPAVQPEFVPTKANAETLSAELPLPGDGTSCSVLYPASLKAKSTLQDGLQIRGCDVLRLNTYSTEQVDHVSPDELTRALDCDVIAIASPSALKAWVRIAGEGEAKRKMLACIGSTSGEAALGLGFPRERVWWSEQPGLTGLVESIEQALGAVASAA